MYQKKNNHPAVLSLCSGNYAKSFYLREINRLAKLPLKTTQTLLEKLEKAKNIHPYLERYSVARRK